MEREGSQLEDHSTLFGQRDKDGWWHPSTFGMLPAHQCFESHDLSRGEIDNWLVVQREFAALQCLVQLLHQGESTDGLLMHARGEDDVMALAFGLRLEERHVGVTDDFRGVFAGALPHDDAHAGVLFNLNFANDERLNKGFKQSVGHFDRIGGRGQSFSQIQELVSPEAPKGVGGAERLLEAPRHRHEELVAHEVTVNVVHALKVVQVKQEHCPQRVLSGDAPRGTRQSVVEEHPIGEPGQWIVQRLVRQLEPSEPVLP